MYNVLLNILLDGVSCKEDQHTLPRANDDTYCNIQIDQITVLNDKSNTELEAEQSITKGKSKFFSSFGRNW